MNQSEVEEHRLESGDRFLLITIKVKWKGSYLSPSRHREEVPTHHYQGTGDKFPLITIKVLGTASSSPSRYKG
jgi:hypothetical protein